jgi:hypothetical protein
MDKWARSFRAALAEREQSKGGPLPAPNVEAAPKGEAL